MRSSPEFHSCDVLDECRRTQLDYTSCMNFPGPPAMFVLIILITVSVAGCTRHEVRDPPDRDNISQFKSSSVAGPDFICVVTENGELIRISHQGVTHRVVQPEPVEVVAFIDSMRGFNVDRTGSVWTTADGGNTWQQQESPQWDGFDQPQQLVFNDASHGWLVGGYRVFRTTDGGKSWQLRFSIGRDSDERMARLYGATFPDPDTGWIMSTSNLLINTSDGGANWKTLTIDALGMDLRDACFINGLKGWVVARNRGGIYSTTDGGKQWEVQPTASDNRYRSIQFLNESEGWVAGLRYINDSGDRTAVLLHTTDGGRNWSEVETSLKERFFERVLFYDQAHGWLVARDNIYATQNGGKTWQPVLSLSHIRSAKEK